MESIQGSNGARLSAEVRRPVGTRRLPLDFHVLSRVSVSATVGDISGNAYKMCFLR